jgi:N-acetylmuramoyl-L-alanine amidase
VRSLLTTTVLLATAWLVTGALDAQPAAQPQSRELWTVLREDGRQPLPVTRIAGRPHVSSGDLAGLLGLTFREDRAGGLVVTFQGQTVVLSLDQGLASIGGRVVSLPGPPVRQGQGWLLPIDVIDRVFATVSQDPRIDVRRRSALVIIGNLAVPSVAVESRVLTAGTRVTLRIAPPLAHTVVREGNRVLVRIAGDAVDADLSALAATGVLEGASVVEPATIAFLVGPEFDSHRIVEDVAGAAESSVTIDFLPAAATPPPTAGGDTAPSASEPAPLVLEQAGLRTVVLDPGHGGTELGARGPSGTLEKDIALAVARQLKAAIESRLGLRVLLTRSGDETVALDARAALANNNKADLFISLHANASVRASVTGAEVFYVTIGDYARATAEAAEPGALLPVLGGGQRSVDLILWEMAQARHIAESARFANVVEEELRQRVPMSPRAIQQAPFRVLVGANMPAVLVEMGFITNPAEEKRLVSSEYQTQLVGALLNAIVRYKVSVDRVGAGAVAQP